MLPRSHRILLQTISKGFCSNKKKPSNKKKDSQPEKPKPKPEEPAVQGKINWASIEFEEDVRVKHKARQEDQKKLFSLLESNKLNEQLKRHFEHLNNELNQSLLEQNVKQYLSVDFQKGYQFVLENIMPLKPEAEHARQAFNKIFQRCIEEFVIKADLPELNRFLSLVEKHYAGKKEGCLDYNEHQIINSLELISQCQLPLHQQPLRYQTLQKFIKVARLSAEPPVIFKKISIFFHKTNQRFIALTQNSTPSEELIEAFEGFLNAILKVKTAKGDDLVKIPQLIKILEILYFSKCENPKKYNRFFDVISHVRVNLEEDKGVQQFYQQIKKRMLKAKLQSTDAARAPFPVNQVLLQNYEKGVKSENRLLTLTCVAVAIANNYHQIPQHLLLYRKAAFSQRILKRITNSIKEDYMLSDLADAIKQQDSERIELINKKLSGNDKLLNLKVAITSKDFEAAMQIFHDNFFKQACINKERGKIEYVLEKLMTEELKKTKNDWKITEIKIEIQRFMKTLNEEYLIESWKKSEDAGYLFEDYYVASTPETYAEEGQEQTVSEESKQSMRYKFWEDHFRLKRAVDVSKFEILNELKSIRQTETQAAVPGQFNLNEYLNDDNYAYYKEQAEYGNKKETELRIYLYRAEAAIKDCEVLGEEKAAMRLLERQNNLCAENIKILEDFGLKDYDISQFDHDELLKRIDTLRRFKGALRNPASYLRIFTPQQEFDDLLDPLDDFAEEQKKKHRFGDEDVEEEGVEELGEQQEVQAVEATEAAETGEAAEETAQVEQSSEEVEGEEAAEEAEVAEYVPVSERHPSAVKVSEVYFEAGDDFKKLSQRVVDIARIKNRNYFAEADICVKAPKSEFVEEMIEFGILNRQPMAIYMAEKMAMMTGQTIPHRLAIRISDMLSHSRQIDDDLVNECKLCLTFIGPINRELIYDNNKLYQHISFKNNFQSMTRLFNETVKERLMGVVLKDHYKPLTNTEPRQIYKRALKGSPLN